jgi:hypothetical protein
VTKPEHAEAQERTVTAIDIALEPDETMIGKAKEAVTHPGNGSGGWPVRCRRTYRPLQPDKRPEHEQQQLAREPQHREQDHLERVPRHEHQAPGHDDCEDEGDHLLAARRFLSSPVS